MARRQDHHAIPPAVPSIGACRFVFWLALAAPDTGLHLDESCMGGSSTKMERSSSFSVASHRIPGKALLPARFLNSLCSLL